MAWVSFRCSMLIGMAAAVVVKRCLYREGKEQNGTPILLNNIIPHPTIGRISSVIVLVMLVGAPFLMGMVLGIA